MGIENFGVLGSPGGISSGRKFGGNPRPIGVGTGRNGKRTKKEFLEDIRRKQALKDAGKTTEDSPVIAQTQESVAAARVGPLRPDLVTAVTITDKFESANVEARLAQLEDTRTGQQQASARHNAAIGANNNKLADLQVPAPGDTAEPFSPRSLVEPKAEGELNQGRVKYADLKALFQNKFLPNELYINKDETSGYNLTAYNITLFALPEALLLGAKINQVAANGLHHYQQSAIIIAQSAGSDEFYIDGLEFDSIIGRAPDEGTGSPPKNISITIKAPTSSDFVDQLMKVAIVGGWKDHIQMPLFIHIEWKARDVDTDAMVTQVPGADFRCFGLYLRKLGGGASPMTIALDEGGSSMTLGANGFTRQSANNQVGRVHEGLTVDGYTVGEILGKVALEMYKLETSGKDNSIVPDEIYITFPKEDGTGINEIKDWKMVVGKSEFFSSVASDANPGKNTIGTEGTPSKARTNATSPHPNASDSTYIPKKVAFADFKKASKKVTYTAKEGDSLVEAIIKICSNTKRAQELISGIPDAQSPDAVKDKKKVSDTDIARKFITITSDIELIGYDPGRRQYAAKHFIKIFLQNGVSWSEAEQITTTQDKKVSTDRLYKMLSDNYIRKCYHHIHTGLNTEVISVDYNFDKTLMYSGQLYSGVVAGFQNRQHGVQLGTANDGASHLGFGDKELNQKRVLEEINVEAAEAVLAIEEDLARLGDPEKVAAGGPPGTQAAAISRRKQEKKDLERKLTVETARRDELARLAKEKNFEALLTGSGATNVTAEFVNQRAGPPGRTTNFFTTEEQVQFRQANALTENQKAFIQPDGRIKVISWDPAPEKDVIVNGGQPLYIKDIDEEITVKALEQGVMFPVQFGSTRLAQDNQGGMRVDYTKGKNVFAEIYNNRKIEMMTLDITIRGDPYWIPITQHDNGDRSVSPEVRENYFILISDQANTWDPNTGIMVLNQRNSLNGVYQVKEVKHTFAGGEFRQDLSCIRGTAIDLNALFGGLSLSEAVAVDAKLREDEGFGITGKIAMEAEKRRGFQG